MKIAAIGSGTGLPVVLKGLKRYLYPKNTQSCNELTAIVTVADDGGSSGRLRREFNILPPGDIRNCLVALANTESFLCELLQYRFSKGRELNGHPIGNLLLVALANMTCDFQYAIDLISTLLKACGRVIPSTLEKVELGSELKDGRIIWGETAIARSGCIKRVFLRPEDAQPSPFALQAIATADAIIIGPGSLYTSLIPNLLIKEITKAISSSPAKKICIMNLMTQPGETDGYTAEDHLDAISRHCGQRIFDYVILNNKTLRGNTLGRYKNEGSMPVNYNLRKIIKMGIIPVEGDVICQDKKIRHDSDKLAKAILEITFKRSNVSICKRANVLTYQGSNIF